MKKVVFTDEQARAAEASERPLDVCVVAGPGSGKTTVLVEYFRNLVAAGVDPLRILAITFTEKAAGNMRKKLTESFHDDARIRASLERAWVSTVHGFCARLLKEYAIFAGVDPDFSVADERDSQRLQQEAIQVAVEEIYKATPAAIRALIRGLSAPAFEDAVRSAYDAMRGAGLSLEELSRFAPPPGVTRAA
ncbi:MAG TPA: UvrD-helicase domain-containing protein, partial [Bryobacteraceae bacterium]|nr:UvrD-helicase domain-containing protein [Bryobacteraceae bacterium]